MSLILKQTIIQNLVNIPGWRTNRKIVVFESDDWGSIRMPSREVYAKLLKKGIRVDDCPYMSNDSLESESDLIHLLETLHIIKVETNKTPIFTFNMVVANPDFEKIKQAGFQQYFFEPFTKTYERYHSTFKSFKILKQGINEGFISPQFHGREHLNVNRWLKLLRKGNNFFLNCFEYNCWGLGKNITKDIPFNIQSAFDANDLNDIEEYKTVLKDGLKLFKNIFGFEATSFIPNNYVLPKELYNTLHDLRILFIQGNYYQLQPNIIRKKKVKNLRYTGLKNKLGQVNLVRNVFFEPFEDNNSVNSCLKQIENAFFWKKPAIIASHRANYIGSINETNRIKNLNKLHLLIRTIIKKWPDVEFFDSAQLGNMIIKNV